MKYMEFSFPPTLKIPTLFYGYGVEKSALSAPQLAVGFAETPSENTATVLD